MLSESIDGDKWKSITMKKLLSFGDKCPVYIKVKTCSKNGEDGVSIIHNNTGKEYFFPWDYSLNPKVFIYNIKETIKYKHYPILIQDIIEDHKLTPEELAFMVEQGSNISDLPVFEKKVIGQNIFVMDKAILHRDTVILEKITPDRKPLEHKQYRYKYNGSIMIFLKKYRNGEFNTVKEASDLFFNNSILINEIIPKEVILDEN